MVESKEHTTPLKVGVLVKTVLEGALPIMPGAGGARQSCLNMASYPKVPGWKV